MKKMRNRIVPLLLGSLLALSGCAETAGDPADTGQGTAVHTATAIDISGLFSDRDLDGSYDEEAAVQIRLEEDGVSCDSGAVSVEGTQVILREEGIYCVSGTLADGQIVVDAGENDKVQIVLRGAEITSSTSAAIYALEADKVFITLADGTENTLANGGTYEAIDDNNIDAVIFAKTDLTLNGTGSLTVEAAAGHGVVSKDDLVVTQGAYTVTSAGQGLSGKDSIAIANGTFTITSGKDGIHAENADDLTLGFLYIGGGVFTISAQGDAVSASGALQIDGGTFDLTTGEGSAGVEMRSDEAFGKMGGRGFRGGAGGGQASPPEGIDAPDARTQPPDSTEADTRTQPLDAAGGTDAQTPPEEAAAAAAQEDTVSRKGIKAEGVFAVNGGVFTMDTEDDCIHAGGDLCITDGEFSLSSGDDAVHCDSAVTIQGGTFTIPYCYEGIEGLSLTFSGGTFHITSHDDGLNAAGGADSSGFATFGGGSRDAFSGDAGSSDCFITINGGTFTIVSSGDCVDSNGDLTINGGTLDLTCNGSNDTALDCDGAYTNNGGDVTTNDGSENNPGQMGGRGGQTGGWTVGSGDWESGERPDRQWESGERPASAE